jgi:archaemetzincin
MLPLPVTVSLIPIYLAETRDMVQPLAATLRDALGVRVKIRKPWFDPEAAYDLSRGQYNSRVLLSLLLEDPTHDGDKIVGVTGVDLFAPVLTYVFGEAQLDGRAAVVSLHRLRPEAYGLPEDGNRVRTRLVTETVHELGHTFGLMHCRDPECVMYPSTYVEEIDFKTDRYCPVCAERVFQVCRRSNS